MTLRPHPGPQHAILHRTLAAIAIGRYGTPAVTFFLRRAIAVDAWWATFLAAELDRRRTLEDA